MTSLPVRLAVATLSGVLAALGFEPYAWPALLPVAVAGTTLAVVGLGLFRGFLVGTAFGIAFMLTLLPWLQVINVPAWLGLGVLEALGYGRGGAATALVARLRLWPLWVAAVWVGVEQLRSTVPFGGFPWGRLGFAVADTPVQPAVTYVGVAGATFLVALVGATLAWALLVARRRPVAALAGLALASLLAVSASAFAWMPLAAQSGPVTSTRVAAVQGDVPGTGLDAFSQRRAVLDNHVRATLELADRIAAGEAPAPDLVVWPENSSDIDPFRDPTARQDIAGAARAVGVPLLMGTAVGDRADDGWANRAIVWSADGEPGAYYDKIHAVPFGEYIPLRSLLAPRIPALDQIPTDMRPGTKPGVLSVGPATVGVVMCFEVAYDAMLRDLVDGGADLIVVPTNNATYTGTGQVEQQFAMSRLRAVETGRYVVVASTNGISGVLAPDGVVVARPPSEETVVLEETLPLLTGTTPAMRAGPWLERSLSTVAVVAALAGLVLGYRRRASRDRTDRQS